MHLPRGRSGGAGLPVRRHVRGLRLWYGLRIEHERRGFRLDDLLDLGIFDDQRFDHDLGFDLGNDDVGLDVGFDGGFDERGRREGCGGFAVHRGRRLRERPLRWELLLRGRVRDVESVRGDGVRRERGLRLPERPVPGGELRGGGPDERRELHGGGLSGGDDDLLRRLRLQRDDGVLDGLRIGRPVRPGELLLAGNWAMLPVRGPGAGVHVGYRVRFGAVPGGDLLCGGVRDGRGLRGERVLPRGWGLRLPDERVPGAVVQRGCRDERRRLCVRPLPGARDDILRRVRLRGHGLPYELFDERGLRPLPRLR